MVPCATLPYARASKAHCPTKLNLLNHEVDDGSGVVVLDFECLIPGKEGRGTDFLQFNTALDFRTMQAVRHAMP